MKEIFRRKAVALKELNSGEDTGGWHTLANSEKMY